MLLMYSCTVVVFSWIGFHRFCLNRSLRSTSWFQDTHCPRQSYDAHQVPFSRRFVESQRFCCYVISPQVFSCLHVYLAKLIATRSGFRISPLGSRCNVLGGPFTGRRPQLNSQATTHTDHAPCQRDYALTAHKTLSNMSHLHRRHVFWQRPLPLLHKSVWRGDSHEHVNTLVVIVGAVVVFLLQF